MARKRRTRRYKGPKRPLRWIYSGMWENDNEEIECAVQQQALACGLPLAVAERSDGGEFWHELVRGEVDLDYADNSAPTVTRVVGDLNVRAGWNWLLNPDPAIGYVDLPPYVRLGMCVIDEPEGTGWIPPDLWDADDGEGVRWLWRAQLSFSEQHNEYEKRAHAALNAGYGGIPNTVRLSPPDANMHLDVRVNATVNKNQSLIMCHSYRFFMPGFLVGVVPNLAEIEDKANIVVSVSHDLRCLVKV